MILPIPIMLPNPVGRYGGQINLELLGFILLGTAAVTAWFLFAGWVCLKQNYIDESVAFISLGIILPLVLFGLVLIG